MCGCDIRRIEEGKEVLPCWMKMNVERFEEHRRVRLLRTSWRKRDAASIAFEN